MPKTPEELETVKNKISVLKEEIRELSEDELKYIAGGDDETDCGGPKCQKCGSKNVSQLSKDGSVIFHCNNCGHEWKQLIL